MITLIIGGARSGKSTFAENYCLRGSNKPAYIATAQVLDSEMGKRVEMHQERRKDHWINYEEPYNVSGLIKKYISAHDIILLDCLTIYITNLMLQGYDYDEKIQEKFMIDKEKEIEQEVHTILSLIPVEKELVIVSNEVGMGIVPEHFLSRVFRDISGRMNQIIGEQSDQIIYTVAGIPIKIKPTLERV